MLFSRDKHEELNKHHAANAAKVAINDKTFPHRNT